MERAKRTWDKMESYGNLSIDDYFDVIEGNAEAEVFGCVHTYALDSFLGRLQTEQPRRSFQISNVIRHPITRIESFWRRNTAVGAEVPKHKAFFHRRYSENKLAQELSKQVSRRHKINWKESNNWYFVLAVLNMVGDRAEIDIEADHVRMEDLVGDADAFRGLFEHLTAGAIVPGEDYIENVAASAPMNEQNAKNTEPEEQFAQWDAWKQDLVREVSRRYDFPKGYGRFGYDLSYLG